MLNSTLFHQRAQEQYQRAQTETASPGQLLLLLYQGCLRFISRARLAREQDDHDAARANLLRAQEIVAELMGSLNLEVGEIATNLLSLYDYMYRRLVDANIRRDDAAAAEVETLLRSLLPAWEEAVRRQPVPQGPTAAAAAAANVPTVTRLPANLAG
jgi:flagellar protein FliS